MANYKGVDLNDLNASPPWGPREIQAFKDIIDSIARDTIDGDLASAKTEGHKHKALYNEIDRTAEAMAQNGYFEVQKKLRLKQEAVAGFLKNDSNGDVTGGNVIDAGAIDIPTQYNGFCDRSKTVYALDDGTRTFTIDLAPGETEYTVWSNNQKFVKTGPLSVVWTDAEGGQFFYFDENGDLTVSTAYSDDYIQKYAFVLSGYWDATNNAMILELDQRHGTIMTSDTHLYLHETRGTAYGDGLEPDNFDIDGSGDVDTNAQMSMGNGTIWDEDLEFTITNGMPQTLSPFAEIPMYYKDGSAGNWRITTANTYPCKPAGAGLRLAFNEFTGGSWQQTEVTNNDYVLTHIYACGQLDEPIIGIQGEAEYSTLALAREGALAELADLNLAGIGFQELKAVCTIIYQTSDSYSNAVKARIVSTDTGAPFIDWRLVAIGIIIGGGGGTNDHGSLLGLGDDDHLGYVRKTGRAGGQTLIGGTGPGDNLILQTTSNASKGNYRLSEIAGAGGFVKNDADGDLSGNNRVNLNSDVDNILPIANGGTGQNSKTLAFNALSPAVSKGALITHNGINNVQLAIDTEDQKILEIEDDAATGNQWSFKTKGFVNLCSYVANGVTQTPPPAAGEIVWDNETQGSAGTIYVADATQEGANREPLWNNAKFGDRLIISNRTNDSDKYQIWKIDAVGNASGYTTLGVSLIAQSDGNFTHAERLYTGIVGGSTLRQAYDDSPEKEIIVTGDPVTFRTPVTNTNFAYVSQNTASATTGGTRGDGSILLGNTTDTTNGNLRHTGTDVEARISGAWKSLTSSGISQDKLIFTFGTNDNLTSNLMLDPGGGGGSGWGGSSASMGWYIGYDYNITRVCMLLGQYDSFAAGSVVFGFRQVAGDGSLTSYPDATDGTLLGTASVSVPNNSGAPRYCKGNTVGVDWDVTGGNFITAYISSSSPSFANGATVILFGDPIGVP